LDRLDAAKRNRHFEEAAGKKLEKKKKRKNDDLKGKMPLTMFHTQEKKQEKKQFLK
jgi:hypothetical protein